MSGEFVVNSNNTTLFPNKIIGSYPPNFRREILNIVINRNDLNSILPYTPYFQAYSADDYTFKMQPYLNTATPKIFSTCAQFQHFAIKQNERDSAYVQYSKILFNKIDNRQNTHTKSMVDNFILMSSKSLREAPKKRRWWSVLTKTNSYFSTSLWANISLINSSFKMSFLKSFDTSFYRANLIGNKDHLEPFKLWAKKINSTKDVVTSKQESRLMIKSDYNKVSVLTRSREEPKNSISNLDKSPFNSGSTYHSIPGEVKGWKMVRVQTIIKKLLYETKELRVFDAKERMRNLETKLFNGVFKEFFNLDPLSQDLDETNGLSEIIHKRRISALGKGGVTSKNAPLSIRSIHPSFYGRLCPIDSPEGDRVGLINSLTNYARINSIGSIATPFYRTRPHDTRQFEVNQNFLFNQSSLTNQYYSLQTSALPDFSKWEPKVGRLRPLLKRRRGKKEEGSNKRLKTIKINDKYNTKILPFTKWNEETQISLLGREPNEISLLAKKSTNSMRICPPIAFFGKIYSSDNVFSSLRLSFQDMIYNFGKTKKRIKWNNHRQNHGKQMIFHIGSNNIERTYKYFMKSSNLRPYQTKSFLPEIALLGKKPVTGNSFIYRFSHFKSTGIHDFLGTLKAMPSFGLSKTQQRGLAYSDFIALPGNLKESAQNDFSYTTRNLLTYKDSQNIPRKLELFLFYDTHYMTPPITHRETIINNAKNKNMGHIDSPFLICYFDFVSFQGYAPITAFQFFSPGVGLIPFLEHDDGTRALMGANMQRQAVPLISASRPIVGTGLEKNIAASFIISSLNSGYLYYISGKQSKQIFNGFRPPIKQAFFVSAFYLKRKGKKEVVSSPSPIWRGRTRPCSLGTSVFEDQKWRPTEKETQPSSFFVSTKKKGIFKNTDASFVWKKFRINRECFFNRAFLKKFYNQRTILEPQNYQIGPYCKAIKPIKKIFGHHLSKKINRNREGHHFILNTHWLPYRKSYKATIINKKPAISENSWLQKGDLLVDGTSSINGELALGRNLFSIYMPWEGYNFEDAILISDKAAQGYTTIHVEEFSVKISKNEFVSSIVKPFTWVNLGDILVSKKRKLENEFIMNRLLFGMSSKPKIKNLDNNFLHDSLSNYNFYGDKSLLEKRHVSYNQKMFSYMISPFYHDKLERHMPLTAYVYKDFINKHGQDSFETGFEKSIGLKNKKTKQLGYYPGYVKTHDLKSLLPNLKSYSFLKNLRELPKKSLDRKKLSFIIRENNPLLLFKTENRMKEILKNFSQQFLVSESEIKDRVRVLNTKTRIIGSSLYKVLISEQKSALTEQGSIIDNEINLDTARRLDDKQSSLLGINEKDLKLLSSQSSFGRYLKKNDNFEIDTSYRTGESICGWVISVKSQSQQSLVSESETKDQVLVLDSKTQMLKQNKSKYSIDTQSAQKSTERILETRNENFNTEPKIWSFSKQALGIYTGSIQKFLKRWPIGLLSVFYKNAQLKNNVFHESREPWTKHFINQKAKSKIFQLPFESCKKISPLGYLLLKSTFETLHFTWPKKPNTTILEWSQNNYQAQFLKKLSFSLPLHKNPPTTDKSWLLDVNPYNVPRIKTERAQLKITKNSRQRPGNDTIYIYVAVAKPLQVGDKMSGRHGNKGIISKILPFYDMPYLIDGTPIDIVLNPLGVPSRMNVGQIYESLLGLTGFYKQEYYRIPPFDENYSSQFSRNFVYWKLNELKDLHFFKRSHMTPQISGNTTRKSLVNMTQLSPFFNSQVTALNEKWPFFLKTSLFFEKRYSFYYSQLWRFNRKEKNWLSIKNKWLFRKPNSASVLKNMPFNSEVDLSFFLPIDKSKKTINQNRKMLVDKQSFLLYNLKSRYKHPTQRLHSHQPTHIKQIPTINWNTSWLWCPKLQMGGPFNNFSQPKFSKIISTNNVPNSFRSHWFLNFASVKSNWWPSSKQIVNSFSLEKHRLDTFFLSKNRPKVEKFGLNPYFPGKMRLLNGLTGETFYRPIIVGKSYMLKLIHLVHHKIHARATGPYALITQQPLKGKRNQGGQRMGEMEIWALYGFGSASILYEMLTIKSDDPVGRERILREIAGLKGNNSSNFNPPPVYPENSSILSLRESTQFWKNQEFGPNLKVNDSLEKGISESFRVLVMNLRALCLDMQVFKDLPN